MALDIFGRLKSTLREPTYEEKMKSRPWWQKAIDVVAPGEQYRPALKKSEENLPSDLKSRTREVRTLIAERPWYEKAVDVVVPGQQFRPKQEELKTPKPKDYILSSKTFEPSTTQKFTNLIKAVDEGVKYHIAGEETPAAKRARLSDRVAEFDPNKTYGISEWGEGKKIGSYLPFLSSVTNGAYLYDIYDASKRLEKGTADDEDILLLQDFVNNANKETTFGYKVLEVVANIPAFAIEFLATSGLFSGAKKATEKAVSKGIKNLLKKETVEMLEKKLAEKGAKKVVGEATQEAVESGLMKAGQEAAERATKEAVENVTGNKFTSTIAKDIVANAITSGPGQWSYRIGKKALGTMVGGTLASSTGGAPRIIAGTIERMIPTLSVDESGKITGAIEEPGQDVWEAAKNSFSDNWVEYVSERTGGLFNELLDPVRKVAMNKITRMGVFGAFVERFGASNAVEKFNNALRKLGWDGVLNEMGEERIGEAMRGVLNSMGLGDQPYVPPTIEQLGIEGLSFGAFGLPFAGVNVAGSFIANKQKQVKAKKVSEAIDKELVPAEARLQELTQKASGQIDDQGNYISDPQPLTDDEANEFIMLQSLVKKARSTKDSLDKIVKYRPATEEGENFAEPSAITESEAGSEFTDVLDRPRTPEEIAGAEFEEEVLGKPRTQEEIDKEISSRLKMPTVAVPSITRRVGDETINQIASTTNEIMIEELLRPTYEDLLSSDEYSSLSKGLAKINDPQAVQKVITNTIPYIARDRGMDVSIADFVPPTRSDYKNNYVTTQQILDNELQTLTKGKFLNPEDRAAYDELFDKLYLDPLSSVPGQRFYQDFKKILDGLYQAMGDIDNFRDFNNAYGHKAGDRVLKWVGKILKKRFDLDVVRISGEEFAIYFDPDSTPAENKEILDKVNAYLAKKRLWVVDSDNKDVLVPMPTMTFGIGHNKIAADSALLAQKNIRKGSVNYHLAIDNPQGLIYNQKRGEKNAESREPTIEPEQPITGERAVAEQQPTAGEQISEGEPYYRNVLGRPRGRDLDFGPRLRGREDISGERERPSSAVRPRAEKAKRPTRRVATKPVERFVSTKKAIADSKNFRFIRDLDIPVIARERILTKSGQQMWGKYHRGIIEFLDNPEEGTVPHEAVHAYLDIMLTKEQKQKILEEVKKVNPEANFDNNQAEEWLAEEFIGYYQQKFANKRPTHYFQRFFEWLTRQFKALFNKDSASRINSFYEDVITKAPPKKVLSNLKYLKSQLPEQKAFREPPIKGGQLPLYLIPDKDALSRKITSMPLTEEQKKAAKKAAEEVLPGQMNLFETYKNITKAATPEEAKKTTDRENMAKEKAKELGITRKIYDNGSLATANKVLVEAFTKPVDKEGRSNIPMYISELLYKMESIRRMADPNQTIDQFLNKTKTGMGYKRQYLDMMNVAQYLRQAGDQIVKDYKSQKAPKTQATLLDSSSYSIPIGSGQQIKMDTPSAKFREMRKSIGGQINSINEIMTEPRLFQYSRRFENLTPDGYVEEKVKGIGDRFDLKELEPINVGIFTDDVEFRLPNGQIVNLSANVPYVISGHNRLEVMKRNLDKIPNISDYVDIKRYPGTEEGVTKAIGDSIITNVKNKTIKDIELLDNAVNGLISRSDVEEAMDYDQKRVNRFAGVVKAILDNNLVDFWNQHIAPKLGEYRNADYAAMTEKINYVAEIAKRYGEAAADFNVQERQGVGDELARLMSEYISVSKQATLTTLRRQVNDALNKMKNGAYTAYEALNLFGEIRTKYELDGRDKVQVMKNVIDQELKSYSVPEEEKQYLAKVSSYIVGNNPEVLKVIQEESGAKRGEALKATLVKLIDMVKNQEGLSEEQAELAKKEIKVSTQDVDPKKVIKQYEKLKIQKEAADAREKELKDTVKYLTKQNLKDYKKIEALEIEKSKKQNIEDTQRARYLDTVRLLQMYKLRSKIVERNLRKVMIEKANDRVAIQKQKTIAEKEKAKARDALKKSMIAFVNGIPKEERGEIYNKTINRIKTIKNKESYYDVMTLVKGLYENLEKNKNIKQIKELVRKINKQRKKRISAVAVDYIDMINDLVGGINMDETREKVLDRFKKTQAYIDKQIAAGNESEVVIPQIVMEKLKLLRLKPITELTAKESAALLQNIKSLEKIGRFKWKKLKQSMDAEAKYVVDEVIANTPNVVDTKKAQRDIGQKLKLKERAYNNFIDKIDSVKRSLLNVLQPDVRFDIIDGLKGYDGPIMKLFKNRIDADFSSFLNETGNIREQYFNLKKQLRLDDMNMERIGVYAQLQQEFGREKLQMIYTNQQIEKFEKEGLSEQEMTMYQFMRDTFESLRPSVSNVLRTVFNIKLTPVHDYFPMITDYERAEELKIEHRFGNSEEDMALHSQLVEDTKNRIKTTTPSKSFSYERKPYAKQVLQLDAENVFLSHISNSIYLKNFAYDLKMLNKAASDDRFTEHVGYENSKYIRDYLELIARKGGIEGETTIKFIMAWRRNMSFAILGFKLSTILIQTTALLTGSSEIGRYSFVGAYNLKSKDWRKFLLDNSAEFKYRVGDDPIYSEKTSISWLKKAQELSYWGIKTVDSWTAGAVLGGAYIKYCREHNIPIDTSKPANGDAMEYANRVLRSTQGSTYFKDLPAAMSMSKHRWFIKVLTQFQTFRIVSVFGRLFHDAFNLGIRKKNYGKFFTVVTWTILASMMASFLSDLTKDLWQAIVGGDDDDRYDQESMLSQIAFDMATSIPYVANVAGAFKYDSSFIVMTEPLNKLIEGVNRVTEGKKTQTKQRGMIDIFEATGAMTGIPGTREVSSILKKFLYRDSNTGTIKKSPSSSFGNLRNTVNGYSSGKKSIYK